MGSSNDIRDELPELIKLEEDIEIMRQVEKIARRLTRDERALAVAESCTAGAVAFVLTSVEDSSFWFDRGFVVYNNKSKTQMLGVPDEFIKGYGAVSEQTVVAMAEGACDNSDADLSIAITGIAGPSGGSTEKPVGTVWMAWYRREDGYYYTKSYKFDGDRHQVRRDSCLAALRGVEKLLS